METFLWLALALPAVTDDFFTNLALMLVAPVIVVCGRLAGDGVSEGWVGN
jgi:hypothetical protein